MPALAKLKLVFELELRGRGDVQMFRVELPGPKITKGVADDARVDGRDHPLALQRARHRGQGQPTTETPTSMGHIKATGDPNVLKLIAQVVERHEQRTRTKKVH